MKRWAGTVVLLSATALTAPAKANCDPAVDYSVKGEYKRSEFVGLVTVRSVSWLDEDRKPAPLRGPLMLGTIPGGFDPYSGALYRASVDTVFKGKPTGNIDIFSENTEARTPLTVGLRYLVFLYRQTRSNDWDRAGDRMIDYCGNSAIAAKAGAKIASVRGLARQH
jgi:hypothetical protein